MANEQNLIPFNELSKDRHRELFRQGGIASGAARRRKREAIKKAKIEQAADYELFSSALDLMSQCAKLLNRNGKNEGFGGAVKRRGIGEICGIKMLSMRLRTRSEAARNPKTNR